MIKYIIIGFLSLIIISPHFVFGYPIGHSYAFNFQWVTAFVGQLLSGNIYPRWLFDYPAGFGAPVFYFYAPAPFYLLGLGSLFCLSCGIDAILSIGHWAIFAISGVTFYFWICCLTGRGSALLFAGCYMFLPYHIIDLEIRSALGESMAYIWMPLILLGIRYMHMSLYSLVLTSLAYAALILSHLPSASKVDCCRLLQRNL